MQKILDKISGHRGSSSSGGGLNSQPHGDNPGAHPPPPSDGYHRPPPDAPLPVYPQPGQHPPGPGQHPPKPAHVRYHDKMTFFHPRGHKHTVMRDLGFTGVLDGKIVWTFGDTLMGRPDGSSMICAVDSTAIGDMQNPMCAHDTALWPNSDNVKCFILPTKEEEADGGLSVYSYGGTNIIELAPNHGIIYYLAIHRPGGKERILGAGVATVKMTQPGNIPVSTRNGQRMWNDFEPAWGDVGAALDPRTGYIYSYGHGPQTEDAEFARRTYLCRVHKDRVLDVSGYEYWINDSRTWTHRRLTTSGALGSMKIEKEHAVFDWMTVNQANPFWSNYFNKWMLLHSTGWGGSDVMVQTADALEGPWEDHGTVASTAPRDGGEDGLRYCATGHPEFDPSGKTVLVTWTRNNMIFGATIEWA